MSAAEDRRARRVELAATVLLALAAVATAWCSYQASRWNGEQARQSSMTQGIRIDAARAQGLEQAEKEVDVATFIAWVNAYKRGDRKVADFYFRRFRPEFRPAVVAWLRTKPFERARQPLTPFVMPEYRLAASAEVARLDAASKASSVLVQRDIQRATNYVLGVVLFATALFFAGISTKFGGVRQREVLLVVGWAIFLCAAVWIASSPVSLSV